MAHISPDFKTKKKFKEAIKAGQVVRCYSEGPFPLRKGTEYVEAPANYHRWYAQVEIDEDGRILKVVS